MPPPPPPPFPGLAPLVDGFAGTGSGGGVVGGFAFGDIGAFTGGNVGVGGLAAGADLGALAGGGGLDFAVLGAAAADLGCFVPSAGVPFGGDFDGTFDDFAEDFGEAGLDAFEAGFADDFFADAGGFAGDLAFAAPAVVVEGFDTLGGLVLGVDFGIAFGTGLAVPFDAPPFVFVTAFFGAADVPLEGFGGPPLDLPVAGDLPLPPVPGDFGGCFPLFAASAACASLYNLSYR